MRKVFTKNSHEGSICVRRSIWMKFLLSHDPIELRIVLHVHCLPSNKARKTNNRTVRHLLAIELTKLGEPVQQEV